MKNNFDFKLVYDGKIVSEVIECSALNESDALNKAFAYADYYIPQTLALTSHYDTLKVEIFWINNPRHQVLFKGVN